MSRRSRTGAHPCAYGMTISPSKNSAGAARLHQHTSTPTEQRCPSARQWDLEGNRGAVESITPRGDNCAIAHCQAAVLAMCGTGGPVPFGLDLSMPMQEQNPFTSEKMDWGGGCSSTGAFLSAVPSRSPPVAIRMTASPTGCRSPSRFPGGTARETRPL
jgi:hypothetical protein